MPPDGRIESRACDLARTGSSDNSITIVASVLGCIVHLTSQGSSMDGGVSDSVSGLVSTTRPQNKHSSTAAAPQPRPHPGQPYRVDSDDDGSAVGCSCSHWIAEVTRSGRSRGRRAASTMEVATVTPTDNVGTDVKFQERFDNKTVKSEEKFDNKIRKAEEKRKTIAQTHLRTPCSVEHRSFLQCLFIVPLHRRVHQRLLHQVHHRRDNVALCHHSDHLRQLRHTNPTDFLRHLFQCRVVH